MEEHKTLFESNKKKEDRIFDFLNFWRLCFNSVGREENSII